MKIIIIILLAILSTFMIVSCSKDHDINIEEEQRDKEKDIFKSITGNTYINSNADFDIEFISYSEMVNQANYCSALITFKENSFKDSIRVMYYLQDDDVLKCIAFPKATLTYKSKDLLISSDGDWTRK